MKLLFDENLSPRLASALTDLFPGSSHVHSLGLGGADDVAVWERAKLDGFILVSKDSDFYERSLLYGFPPKVLWIRRGNCSTSAIEAMIRDHFDDIANMDRDPEIGVLLIF
ncbi:DUF5615 family PIN-like protein [Methylocaldum sp.]|uniref:DUF5615 family PIN-like protein n=1 Tax=Methylocaldum sp. TaxID=1969727 RepID=UPI002D2A24FA|nr:DUF5615 family PIN-like protein [Methylocaldum sp.]HYE36760.1 DUF5615 family PIN-like protein [Methylocaldum sp.]